MEGIHDGDGGIAVRPFFRGLTRSGINLHVWELPPGTSEGRHTHAEDDPDDAYEEIYLVLDGRGTLHVEGEDVPLETGDAVLVPVNVDHGLSASRDVALRIAIVFALI